MGHFFHKMAKFRHNKKPLVYGLRFTFIEKIQEWTSAQPCLIYMLFVGLAYQGKDIVFRFIIEYSSLRDFGPYVIGLFLYEDF